MRIKLLSGVAIGALGAAIAPSPSAQAQPPAFAWSGFYVGANVGAAWGRSNTQSAVDCTAATAPPGYFCATGTPLNDAVAVASAGTGLMRGSAFTGGVQAGYNWQADRLLYGLEGDFGTFHLSRARQVSGTYPISIIVPPNAGANAGDPFTMRTTFGADWLATFRGRLGWTLMPSLAAYATGGLAVTSLKVGFSFGDINTAGGGMSSGAAEGSKIQAGWTAGGGLEWMLDPHTTVKAEYLYVSFAGITAAGIVSIPGSTYAQGLSTTSDLTAHVARVGMNYKF